MSAPEHLSPRVIGVLMTSNWAHLSLEDNDTNICFRVFSTANFTSYTRSSCRDFIAAHRTKHNAVFYLVVYTLFQRVILNQLCTTKINMCIIKCQIVTVKREKGRSGKERERGRKR